MSTDPVRPSDIPTLRYAYLTISYEMSHGRESTIDGVIERLHLYSLEQVVALVGRISRMLRLYPAADRVCQTKLASALFGRDNLEKIDAAIRHLDPDERDRWIVFHERQLLNLLKVAFLVLDPGGPDGTETSVEPLGEALLMMNDLIDRGVSGRSAEDRGGENPLERYLFANTLFNVGREELAEIARAHELFIRPNPEIEGADLVRERLARATGVDPDFAWFALCALHLFFMAQDEDEINRGASPISLSRGFTDAMDLKSEESERAFSVAAVPAARMKELVAERYTLEDLRSFDVLPFALRPLVGFGDNVHCLSSPLLRDLAGMNIQYRLLDPAVFDEKEREEFLQLRGRLFEDYLSRLLRRTFGPVRHYGPDELEGPAGDESSCDAVIHYGDAVLLLEFKAAIVPLAARTGESREQYERRILAMLVRSAGQLDSTIRLLEEGRYRGLGLDPAAIHEYLPITVVMDPMMNPLIYRRLRDEYESAGIYRQPKTMPFQIMDVQEVELMETAVAHGASVLDLLHEKLSDDGTIVISFKNFCAEREEPWFRRSNPHLAERYRVISEEIKRYTRKRTRRYS